MGGRVEIRAAGIWPRYGVITVIAALAIWWMLGLGTTSPRPVGIVLSCLMFALYAASLLAHVRLRRMPYVLRLDDTGVTAHGEQVVAWQELAEVHWRPRPGVLAFVPRDAQQLLPVVPFGILPVSDERRRAGLLRRYGTPLIVLPSVLDVSSEDLVAAVRLFGGDLPIREL